MGVSSFELGALFGMVLKASQKESHPFCSGSDSCFETNPYGEPTHTHRTHICVIHKQLSSQLPSPLK